MNNCVENKILSLLAEFFIFFESVQNLEPENEQPKMNKNKKRYLI